jgi:hypothetical protein
MVTTTAAVAWHVLFALNGIQLSVLDCDASRACELLADDVTMTDEREEGVDRRRMQAFAILRSRSLLTG